MANAIQQRWNMLSEFVQTTCVDRDESHGHAHMKAVAETSLHIINKDYQDRRQFNHLKLDAITAAWLHDIADSRTSHFKLTKMETTEQNEKIGQHYS